MPILSSRAAASARAYGLTSSASLITTNLALRLEAFNTASYPGSGTVWYDLSGNGLNYNVVSGAYNSSGPGYMDFNGSYGLAKRGSDFTLSGAITMMVWTRVRNSTSDWRTLTRAYGGDHQPIFESGSWRIGMYDNDGAAYLDSGALQTSIPGNGTTTWACLYFRWDTVNPHYTVSWNDTPGTIRGSINNSNAQFNRGPGVIGGYSPNTSPGTDNHQYFGDISSFYLYSRKLTDSELLQNFNATRGRYGI